MKVLAAYNIKGGVGKTATAVNLAYLAAAEGLSTLLWDLDPQGAASFYYQVDTEGDGAGVRKLLEGKRELDGLVKGTQFEGLDLVPADFSYRKLDVALSDSNRPSEQLSRLLRPLVDSYDLVVLDCPPSMSLLAEAIFHLSDALLIPTIPTPLSQRALEQIHEHLGKKKLDDLAVLPFLSMVDRRKRLHREPDWLVKASPWKLMKAQIPYASVVEMMGVLRRPVVAFAASSPAGVAYQALWSEVKRRLGGIRPAK
jgi:cellulose biosynthesis protein BcsQ